MPSEKERFREIDEHAKKFWDEYYKKHPETRPVEKPPEMEKEAEEWDRLEKGLKEPPEKLLPAIPKRDLESILDVFNEFSDDEKHDRRIIFGESLQLAQRAEEDPKIEYDIRYYQSGIVNAALRILTLDDVPEWVAEEGLKKLRMQVQRVFRPTHAPVQTGLRYKDPERMAKCLKVDLEKLLEEWTIIDRDSLAFIGITEEEIIRLPKPTKERVPKKPPKPVKRAAKK